MRTPPSGRCYAHVAVHTARCGEVCACASGSRGQKAREKCAAWSVSAHTAEAPRRAELGSCPWSFSVTSVFMAFAPMGPEASFFEVLDQHRASLLAALRRGGGEPAGRGTRPASRYRAPRARCPAGGKLEPLRCLPGAKATGRPALSLRKRLP